MASVIGTHVVQSPGGPVVHVPPNGNSSYSDYAPYIDIFEMGYYGAQSAAFSGGVIVPSTSTVVTGVGAADDGPAINAAIAALAGTGRTLYFPKGIFLITTAIVNTTGVPMIISPQAQFTGANAFTMAAASGGAASGQNLPGFVRAVMTTVATSTTYTGTTTGTLTFGSNAAIGTQDGVTTLAVGDCVLLQGGTLGSCAITACDTGPWLISALGTASVKCVLVRPSWYQVGSVIPIEYQLQVGPEGNLFKGTRWTSWASTPAAGVVISATTTDPLFYPDKVQCLATLVASSFTLSTIPFRSFTATSLLGNTGIYVTLAAVGGTTTSTVGYGPIAISTAGYVGTCTSAIVAQAAGMTKNGTSDTSIVSILVVNRGN